jgi:hypothetical protein
MSTESEALAPLVDNPFYLLALPVDATRASVEREGQKLLDQLDLGVARVATYATPLGPRTRTPEKVRWALTELRDPGKRLHHEAWASLEPTMDPGDETTLAAAANAFEAAGF